MQVVYKARGSNASWTWLEEISPCITTLRELANQVNTSLAPPNSTNHTSPSLNADIDVVLKSLVEESIHTQDSTRHFSNAALRARDVLTLGLQSLECEPLNHITLTIFTSVVRPQHTDQEVQLRQIRRTSTKDPTTGAAGGRRWR
jgi:hypothetical protein